MYYFATYLQPNRPEQVIRTNMKGIVERYTISSKENHINASDKWRFIKISSSTYYKWRKRFKANYSN